MDREFPESCVFCNFVVGDHRKLNYILHPTYRQDFGSPSILGGNPIFERLFSFWPHGHDNARSFSGMPGLSSASWADNIDAVRPNWLADELKRLFPETVTPPPPPPPSCLFTDSGIVVVF